MGKATLLVPTTFFLFNIVCGLLPGHASNYVNQLYHKKINYDDLPIAIKAPNSLPLVHGHDDHSKEIHPKQIVSNESPISNYHLRPVVFHVPVFQLLNPSTPNQSSLSQTQAYPSSIVCSEAKVEPTHGDLEMKPTSYIPKLTNTDLDDVSSQRPLKFNPLLNNNVENEESDTPSLHFSKNTIIVSQSDDDESTRQTSIKSESTLDIISDPEISYKDNDQQTTKVSESTFIIDREGSKLTTSKKLINVLKNKNNLSYKLDIFSVSKTEDKDDATEIEY